MSQRTPEMETKLQTNSKNLPSIFRSGESNRLSIDSSRSNDVNDFGENKELLRRCKPCYGSHVIAFSPVSGMYTLNPV